jgi:hypothetical protein
MPQPPASSPPLVGPWARGLEACARSSTVPAQKDRHREDRLLRLRPEGDYHLNMVAASRPVATPTGTPAALPPVSIWIISVV